MTVQQPCHAGAACPHGVVHVPIWGHSRSHLLTQHLHLIVCQNEPIQVILIPWSTDGPCSNTKLGSVAWFERHDVNSPEKVPIKVLRHPAGDVMKFRWVQLDLKSRLHCQETPTVHYCDLLARRALAARCTTTICTTCVKLCF